jgi:hypothetical protein
MLIDTFPAFTSYWNAARHDSIEEQIRGWRDIYMAAWPELFAKVEEDYRSQGLDWRDIARERIFPYIGTRMGDMVTAHDNLLLLCEPVVQRAKRILDFECPVSCVIYVGIGCGAGWATSYEGSPAVLLGLENIAEENWIDPDILESLLSHEVSHLVYHHWRKLAGQVSEDDPWGQLMDEGFAQYCESCLIKPGQFHENNDTQKEDWLGWCSSHIRWLAAEFLRATECNEPVSKFFGSWFDIEGQSQTGYFLGQQVILGLADQGLSMKEIALLNPKEAGKKALHQIIWTA